MPFDDILASALQTARGLGADYADARGEDISTEALHVRNGSVERLTDDQDSGWGVHVLAGGGWGFASSSARTSQTVKETVQRAVEIACASGTRRTSKSDLSIMPTEQGAYRTPLKHDPFSVPVGERIDLLMEAVGRIQSADHVKVALGHISVERHDKLYTNSLGAHLSQQLTYVQFRITGVAVDETGYSYRRSFDDMSQAGWEFIEAQDLPVQGTRVGREASDLVAAPWAPSGPHTVVLASDFVALLVHELCGHPTELDRVLGWEAAFAGTSFLMPDMRGSFRYGSGLVNMTAELAAARRAWHLRLGR